jgi:hypothetical protein
LVDSERLGDDRSFWAPPCKGSGREIAKRAAPPPAIVEDLDAATEGLAGLGVREERPAGEKLTLQGGKEALGERIN